MNSTVPYSFRTSGWLRHGMQCSTRLALFIHGIALAKRMCEVRPAVLVGESSSQLLMYSLDTGIRYSTYLLIFKSQTLGSNSGSQQPFMHAEHFETFHSNYIISFIIHVGFIIGFIIISSWLGRILFVDWDNLKTLLHVHPSSFMKSITPRYCMLPTIHLSTLTICVCSVLITIGACGLSWLTRT